MTEGAFSTRKTDLPRPAEESSAGRGRLLIWKKRRTAFCGLQQIAEGIVDGHAAFVGVAQAAVQIRLAVLPQHDAGGEGAVLQFGQLGRRIRIAAAETNS